ncbi:phospholipase A2 [Nonomuraea sp. NPDC049480]|uniref:phospholipase A2 n=1 Tax=Nonomuraea sp. NPDC049480 TaxID=3364353 RepID=UPI0037A5A790
MKTTAIISSVLVTAATALVLASTPAAADARLNVALSLTKNTTSSQTYWANMRRNKNEPYVLRWSFNWNTDGCSVPKDIGNSDYWKGVFKTPCDRHDFGYRNVKKMVSSSKWKNTYKKPIDDAFLFDMGNVCVTFSGTKKASCRIAAAAFYGAVRAI